MKPFFFLLISLLTFVSLNGQTVIINPDGTHSTVFDNGGTKTIVNPNGTFSTVFDKGPTKTIVNPNGTF
jgi:hypothetical protein